MKTFKCNYSELMRAEEELKAECIDCLEGTLIDDCFLSYPGGYLICLETYQNCWSSIYTVYSFSNEEWEAAFSKWEEYKKHYFELYPDMEAKYYG